MNIKLQIIGKDGQVKLGKNDYEEFTREMCVESEDIAYLATQDLRYEAGDIIRVEVAQENTYLVVKLDETLESSLIFLKDKVWEYHVPLAENEIESAVDTAFRSKRHYLSVRVARPHEINVYRNLAFNAHDQKTENGAYPHASANVETRNDSTFFAKNVINGMYANLSHGSYPYHSWGINRQADAAITVDFGRPVKIDKVGLVLRADFPHDSHWTSVTLEFSDGSHVDLQTIKSEHIQVFAIEPKAVTTVTLKNLIKAEDESPFPALTEFEVYGEAIAQ